MADDEEKTKNVKRKTSEEKKEEGSDKNKEKGSDKGREEKKEKSEKPEPVKKDSDPGSSQNKLFVVLVVLAIVFVSFYAVFVYMQAGDDGNGNGPKENELPIAEAGDNIEINTLEPYLFSGTASHDPDGEIVSYS